MLSLIIHEIRIRRGAILGWGFGTAGFALLYISIYPQFADQMSAFQNILDLPIYQALGVTSMSTFSGYASSTLLNFLPIILGIYALITSTFTLAGEEDRGTLEILVALPLARWQIVIAKSIALIITVLLIMLFTEVGGLLSLYLVLQQVNVDVSTFQFAIVIINALPITYFFMMLGLFLGAFLPTRGAASMMATAILIISYLGNNLFRLVESLQEWRRFFPFYYYDSTTRVFQEGIQIGDVLILLSGALLFWLLAIASFNRRNLMTHAWFWQRPYPSKHQSIESINH
ncbi:MAG TPA: ABC transporter permease subunit [Anaerolineae bacterium]|nr:ABC transporter permease subunit [Anaerolineae bacterium]